MTKTKSVKQRLISAVLVLVMMVTSLLGTTFAWFTDEVTSAGNKIETGSLKVDLLHKTGENWVSLKDNPDHKVFDYDKWEPGYTQVETLKIANLGSLALQYRLSVEVADGTAVTGKNGEDLADVIDVYVTYSASTAASLGDIAASNAWVHKGTLAEAMKNPASFVGGQLLPTGEVQSGTVTESTAVGSQMISIALHMQESADNEYQELSVGDIYVNLLATQWSYENDSFGNDYDGGATFPSFSGDYVASAPVEVNGDNTVKNEVVLKSEEEEVSATVPAGALLLDGVNTVTLTVSSLGDSESNIELSENEVMNSVDVHVSGIADGNTAPILVTVKGLLAKGLNMGNYELYHVENGNTVAMTYVMSTAALDAHNEFAYDPATGDVTMALCSFSEITLVSNTENAWEGNFDDSWYDVDETELYIANADQLAAFGAIVGGMDGQTADSFAGKTVTLLADINLGDKDNANESLIFYPIGYYNNTGSYDKVSGKVAVDGTEVAVSSYYKPFEGTFNGNGNTIANFYQNTWEMFGDYNDGYSGTPNHSRDGMGLFGNVYGGTVKNLTVESFSSDGEFATTGVIAAYADSGNGKSAIFENIAIFECNPRVYNIGNGGIVGCAGWYSRSDETANGHPVVFKNITVDQTNMISALWGSYDVSCGGILGQYYPDSRCGVTFENCHIAAVMDVNNDVCANYQYYWYRYSGMLIGTIRANKTEGNYTVADTTGITVTDCTYTLGEWNEYWYCELVKNSLASYTHDHQFSRLTKIESLEEIKNGDTWLKEGNFVLPAEDNSGATCYHIFKDSEGNLYEHKHDSSDESNNYNPYETFDLNGDGELNDLKEDRQCYYMPFNQVFNGLGYGVKPTYEISGLTEIKDGPVNSEEKFENKNSITTYRPGQTIALGDLVSAVVDESKISKATLYVAVSPATEADKASGSVSINTGDWANTTITFAEDCEGVAKIVITDYFYCKKTVIYLNPEEAAAKFTPNSVSSQSAYSQITLGSLFVAKADATIGNVAATVTDPAGNTTTVTGATPYWTSTAINLTKDGTWIVAIKDDDAYCALTTVTFTVNKVDKFEVAFDHDDEAQGKQNYVDTYLYRVGNLNTVTLGWLFSEIKTEVGISSVNIAVESIEGNVTYTFTPNATWTSGAVKFTGTGVVAVTISADGANDVILNLEVVDAKNITKAESATSTSVVLLNNISGGFSVSGEFGFYANGFTVTLDSNSHSTAKGAGYAGYIHMNGGTIDNVIVIGPVFAESNIYQSQGLPTGTTTSDTPVEYFRNVIVVDSGNAKITNSYISGARTALLVKSGGDVVLENTRLSGGAYANIEILASNSITLKNVVTEQKELKDSYGNDKDVIGAGIVINSADTKLVLDGLTQYNWMTQTQWENMLGTYANSFPKLFSSSYSQLHHTFNGTTVVNTGIIWACNVATPNIVGSVEGYDITYVSLGGISGAVYTTTKTSSSATVTLSNEDVNAPTYVPTTQGAVPPTTSIDHTKNNEPETNGSNVYCYYNVTDGKYLISFDEGGSRAWTYDILSIVKGKNTLPYSVSVSGDAVVNSDNTITFSNAGDYTVTYTYTDNLNYNLNNGEIETYSIAYTKTVYVTVYEVEPEADPTTFAFGSDGYKMVTADGLSYVMPNVTATKDPTKSNNVVTASGIGSKTIGGETIYYPIIGMHKVGSSLSYYNYFSIFEGVTITDANGTKYNVDTTTLPSNLTVIGGFIDSGTESANGTAIFNYSTGKTIKTKSVTVKGTSVGLCYYPDSSFSTSTTARAEQTIVVKYCYTDTNGKAYYYYIGYWCAQGSNGVENSSSSSTCIAEGSMITLADGTKKAVEDLRKGDVVMAFDHITGKIVHKDVLLVGRTYADSYYKNVFVFDDGTELNAINAHGIYDLDLNKYVNIDHLNSGDYIGHRFVSVDSLGNIGIKRLVDVITTVEAGYKYDVVTDEVFNYVVEDTLSVSHEIVIIVNSFEFGENMIYDTEAMQADIEKYALYTYEDFAEYCDREVFEQYNMAMMKVGVGKGLYTYGHLVYLLTEIALNDDVQIIG